MPEPITLQELAQALSAPAELTGKPEPGRMVTGITEDSRTVRPGSMFVAVTGTRADGHRFIRAAIDAGCTAVVTERPVDVPPGIAVIRVADSRRACGELAAAFYRHPARRMTMIGLTGTNGKTTTSWIIEQMLCSSGKRPGVIGTVNYRYRSASGKQVVREAPLTTPEPVRLHGLLHDMLDAGTTHVVMEVSSHALAQQRLSGLTFDIGLFTNLSRDHLDYHRDMEDYFAAKRTLFTQFLAPEGVAVVMADGPFFPEAEEIPWGRRLLAELATAGFSPAGPGRGRQLISCGFDQDCTVQARNITDDVEGLSCDLVMDDIILRLHSRLIGRHNLLNMLAAAGIGCGLGLQKDLLAAGLQKIRRVPGRLERVDMPVPGDRTQPRVFVDYAHTPDALANVLRSLRPLTAGLLFCVFGCGGDRDRGKRPEMGAIAARYADRLLITSDNPRSEEPMAIIREIVAGVKGDEVEETDLAGICSPGAHKAKYFVLEDRRQVIHAVCALAGGDDIVLIAGKGHETYQITAGSRRHFDDRLEARNGALRWTTDHLCAATGGELLRPAVMPLLGSISTDSRNLQQGDVFLALRGEHFDGHDFIPAAVERGAGAVIVSDPGRMAGEGPAFIRVDDTLRALGDLAAYRRRALAPGLLVTAITGSSGKTTVKEMTAAIFAAQYRDVGPAPVLKTPGNLNNLVGLPLTVLQADGGHRAAVLEMGMNRPGEIARLAGIAAPDIGCITNVQPAHLEGLGSIEGVAAAKKELFATMPARGIRVVNVDDPHLRGEGGKNGDTVVSFAVTPAGRRKRPRVRVTRIAGRGAAGMRFTLHIDDWRQRLTVPATGRHNVANCAAAAAIATGAGIAPEIIVKGLAGYRCGDKRLQIVELAGGLMVVNDAYNANPASMRAALDTVREFGGSRSTRVAVLGDMLELGREAGVCHRRLGCRVVESGYDFLAVTGGHAGEVAAGAVEAGMPRERIGVLPDTGAIVDWLARLHRHGRLHAGDWILIKGSRGMRMERVLEGLQQKWGIKGETS